MERREKWHSHWVLFITPPFFFFPSYFCVGLSLYHFWSHWSSFNPQYIIHRVSSSGTAPWFKLKRLERALRFDYKDHSRKLLLDNAGWEELIWLQFRLHIIFLLSTEELWQREQKQLPDDNVSIGHLLRKHWHHHSHSRYGHRRRAVAVRTRVWRQVIDFKFELVLRHCSTFSVFSWFVTILSES